MQFSADTRPSVDIWSNWQKETKSTANSTQTKPAETSEVEAQSLEIASIGIQTNPTESLQFAENVDARAVGEFLKSVEPLILKTVRQNNESKAFLRYDAARSQLTDVSVENTHLLKHGGLPDGAQALCVDWNSNGSTLATVYGRSQHEDWCTHKGMVCTWNVDRRRLDAGKADFSLEVESCAVVGKFNPSEPALLAVGCFDGALLVLNLAAVDGQALTASSSSAQYGHREMITAIEWIATTPSDGTFQMALVTGGNDGRILVWTIPTRGQTLSLSAAYTVTIGQLPRSLRGRATNTEKESGVTAVAFSRREPEMFVAGGETGALFHCNLHSRDPLSRLGELQAYNPVVLSLRPHKGPVHAVRASPFHRNLFLSCAADGQTRVYSIVKLEPLISCQLNSGYLYDASWSNTRPLVFAVATHGGTVALFDLHHSEMAPITTVEVTTDKAPVYSVAMNPRRADLFASADANGVTKVWKMGDRLSTQLPTEENDLLNLAARVADE